MPTTDTQIPLPLLDHWSGLRNCVPTRIPSGLINLTYLLTAPDGSQAILQRLHPVFPPEVNLNLARVTTHLAARGLTTPKLIPTDSGALWVQAADGIWRAQTYIPGRAPQRITTPALAAAAGRLVARFHLALADLPEPLLAPRAQVHDTPAHLRSLTEALNLYPNHRLHAQVQNSAGPLLAAAPGLADLQDLPLRPSHGDLKATNLMFDAAGQGICLIDLDTLAPMAWPLEIGDALRSWCNPQQEDRPQPRLDLDLFRSAMTGYRDAAPGYPDAPEWRALVPGLERICLELAARFLNDALRETYFGWDPDRYPARGEHNLARGQAMWGLYRDVTARRDEALDILARLGVI